MEICHWQNEILRSISSATSVILVWKTLKQKLGQEETRCWGEQKIKGEKKRRTFLCSLSSSLFSFRRNNCDNAWLRGNWRTASFASFVLSCPVQSSLGRSAHWLARGQPLGRWLRRGDLRQGGAKRPSLRLTIGSGAIIGSGGLGGKSCRLPSSSRRKLTLPGRIGEGGAVGF